MFRRTTPTLSIALAGVTLLPLVVATACHGASPTSPSPSSVGDTSPSGDGDRFEVTGKVIEDATGRPLSGVNVTMHYRLGGLAYFKVAMTDLAGAYSHVFTANPFDEEGSRAAAHAELIGGGYERYSRTVYATGPQLVENFQLRPLQRIAAGETLVLPVRPDDGPCVAGLSWSRAQVCRTFRVIAQANGRMTVRAVSEIDGERPEVSVCCVGGDDRDGNPVTLPVTAGTAYDIEIGLLVRPPTAHSVTVSTSFDP